MRKTTDQFIKDAKQIHGNRYDYSLVEYKNNHTYIKIKCNIHNVFEQMPKSHLKGYNCIKCSGRNKKTNKEFIFEAKNIHNNKYDYSLVEYKNNKQIVKIICPKHNIFEQIAKNHLKGMGCKKCSGLYKKTTTEFIKNAKIIHNNTYDYSNVKYINNKIEVDIKCNKHGIFKQRPDSHLNGKGCKTCNSSKGEKHIRLFLLENNISFIEQYRFKNQQINIKNCKYDFYLVDYNTIIEYHGEQHFYYNAHFHEDFLDFLSKVKVDYEKKSFCDKNNVYFYEIHYNQNIDNKLNQLLQHFQIDGKALKLLTPLLFRNI